MTNTLYRSRYAAEDAASDEAWAKAQAEVSAAMVRLFGPQRYAEGFDGGVILRVSNGTPPEPEAVNCDGPRMSEAWRRMVAKARRDIDQFNRDVRVARLADTITDDQFELWCSILSEGKANG